MKRRRKRWLIIGASILGALLVLLLLTVVVLLLTMPDSPSLDPIIEDEQHVPASWLAPPDVLPTPTARSAVRTIPLPYPLFLLPITDPPTDATPSEPAQGNWIETSGVLRMASDGELFGQEQFEIRKDGDSIRLSATGEFFFKVVLVTVRISFDQELVVDGNGRPQFYRLATQAPLGRNMLVEATFSEDSVDLMIDGDPISRMFPLDQAIVIGTFSSYALLPSLLAVDGVSAATFDVLLFGGPPGTAQGGESEILPQMLVSSGDPVRISSGDLELDADVYNINGPISEGVLYTRDGEILGLTLASGDGDIDVWRSDYFTAPVAPAPSDSSR